MKKKKSEFTFDGQRPDEVVLHVWRQHPWVMGKVAMLVVVIIFLSLIPLLLPGGFTGINLIIGALIISAMLITNKLYLWWNTVYVLSNQRIIGIEQKQLISKVVREVPLKNIQNTTIFQNGMGPTTFGYGTIKIQTAGGKTALRVHNVENPIKSQQLITEAAHKNNSHLENQKNSFSHFL